jgi:hypothetical protein
MIIVVAPDPRARQAALVAAVAAAGALTDRKGLAETRMVTRTAASRSSNEEMPTNPPPDEHEAKPPRPGPPDAGCQGRGAWNSASAAA